MVLHKKTLLNQLITLQQLHSKSILLVTFLHEELDWEISCYTVIPDLASGTNHFAMFSENFLQSKISMGTMRADVTRKFLFAIKCKTYSIRHRTKEHKNLCFVSVEYTRQKLQALIHNAVEIKYSNMISLWKQSLFQVTQIDIETILFLDGSSSK